MKFLGLAIVVSEIEYLTERSVSNSNWDGRVKGRMLMQI